MLRMATSTTRTPRRLALFLALGWLFLPAAVSLFAQLSTADHLTEPGFWPTQSAPSRNEFLGAAACSPCHKGIVDSQKHTPMGGTAVAAGNSAVLHSHPKMSFAFAPYRYEIQTGASGSTYSIGEPSHNLSATLLWAFGTGHVGQSYLFKKEDGNFYEARVTYFSSLANLHFTPTRELSAPAKTLEEAMYRPVSPGEVSRCFGCHTTASSIDGQFQDTNLILGVSCEACHGAGTTHVQRMQANKLLGISGSAETRIFSPRQLSPADSVDFCGACHGTWWDTKLAGVKGPSNARSQPYRLENSKCWGRGDARLTCIACHDPHKQLQTEPAAYDNACLSCHLSSRAAKHTPDHPGAACPVASQDCTTCHMPKVYVPEMHHNFTDHRIRIARPGDPYPD